MLRSHTKFVALVCPCGSCLINGKNTRLQVVSATKVLMECQTDNGCVGLHIDALGFCCTLLCHLNHTRCLVMNGTNGTNASQHGSTVHCPAKDVEEHEEEVDNTFAFFDGSQWVVTGEGMLDLIDLQGRILWQRKISGGQSRVSLPNVAKSMYLLRLVNSKETKIQKIIAE